MLSSQSFEGAAVFPEENLWSLTCPLLQTEDEIRFFLRKTRDCQFDTFKGLAFQPDGFFEILRLERLTYSTALSPGFVSKPVSMVPSVM